MFFPPATGTAQSASPYSPPAAGAYGGARRAVVNPGRADGASALGLLEAEPDLHGDLEMADLAVHDVPADVGGLEPVEVPQGLCGAGQPVADGVVDRLRRRADD